MIMKKILLLLTVICSFVEMDAQETIFRNFSATQYKGGTQNWDIKQLPDGRMAIANNFGVLIYDGVNWTMFPIRNYSTVRALFYDKATNRLYAGASNEFGYFEIDPLTYRNNYHSLSDFLPASARDFGEIWKIVSWRGRIVFQSKSHLFILGKDGKPKSYHSSCRIETMALVENRLILGTRRGLEEWNGRRSVLLPQASFSGDVIVRSIMPYGKYLLVATQQDGILTYDGKRLLPDMSELAPIYKNYQIFCAEKVGNKLAVGTVKSGLVVKDLLGGQTMYLNSSKGLLNNTVLSTAFDREGNIWLGLDNGLSCAILNVPFQNIVSERYSIGTGCCSVKYGGTLYLGTNQGLFMMQLPFSQQLVYRQPMPVSGISGQIWDLQVIDGTLYCCADGGLFVIRGAQASKIDGSDGTWGIQRLKKHPGYFLLTDYLGMALLRKEGDRCRLVARLKSPVDVSGNLFEDTDGTIWMSHWQKGIYHLRLSQDMKSIQLLETFNANHGLVVDEGNVLCNMGGYIYISSVDGFYRYDQRTRKLVYDKKMSQVFDTYGSSLRVVETPQHDLLAQKQDFLAIAHVKEGGYVVDSTSYRGIVKTQQMGMGNSYSLGNGYAIVNSIDGFYLIKENFKLRGHEYPLFINKITATNDGDSVVFRHATFDKTRKIVLSHHLNSIVLEFVTPEYLSEDAITYSCFLENYDSRWSLTSSNTKEYTQLAKGSYTFHVKAYNRITGKTQEVEMEIEILPAWYETIWAYLLYILIGCALLYELVRYLKYRADRELMIERTKRKAEQAEMQNERLQNELKHKSSELASSTMSSIHQNDILQKLDEEMSLLSESVRREDKKTVVTGKINEIRNNLQSYLNDDEGWDKFEENFNVVYDDFMKKLTEQYTNLKTSDRKLCAYLRMGLSSKEMASLLNMSVRSIETARYRLRKKLNLESGENLTDFIQNFNKNLQTIQGDKHEE